MTYKKLTDTLELCSLELSIKLKEIGIVQNSYWYWYNGKGFEKYPALVHPDTPYKKVISAFSTGELAGMLPSVIKFKDGSKIKLSIDKLENNKWSVKYKKYKNSKYPTAFARETAASLADALAKMVIWKYEYWQQM